MDTITKHQATAQGLQHYYTGNPCKYGHLSPRYVVSGMCVKCAKVRGRNRAKIDLHKVEVIKKTEGHCWYCGKHLNLNTLEVDHIHPKSKGGSNDISNLVPSCKACNNFKNSLDLEAFRVRMAHAFEKRPYISSVVLAWLAQKGIALPMPERYVFWAEKQI